METKTLGTQEGMEDWDSTWKYYHMPMWFKKKLRIARIERDTWFPGGYYDSLQSSLWDHWGSIIDPFDIKSRKVVTQPYGEKDELAESFAEEHDMAVLNAGPGPWHPKTRMYIFEKL